MTTLGEAAVFLSGGTPQKNNPSYWGGEIPWYSASNMTTRFIGNTKVRITEEGLRIGSRIAPAGSTLLLTRGSGLFNHVPICFAERDVAFNQDVKAIVAKDHVDPVFLHYWLESLRPMLNHNIGVTGIGAGKFDLSFLASLPFPDLGRTEQERLGREADAFDRKIALNAAMNDTLDATARALFRDWFVDFGPVRAKIEGRESYLAPDVWAIFPDRLDKGGKPIDWNAASIYDFAQVIYGAPFASSHFNDQGNGLPLIRIRDLSTHNPNTFTDETHANRRIISPGDLIVGMDGEFRCHLWKGPASLLNQRLCHFRPMDGIPTIFLSEAIAPLLDFYERGKVGTTVIHLSKSDIDTFRIIAPANNILHAFSRLTQPMIKTITANAAQNRQLAATRDALLPRLLSGELRIADAIHLAEAA